MLEYFSPEELVATSNEDLSLGDVVAMRIARGVPPSLPKYYRRLQKNDLNAKAVGSTSLMSQKHRQLQLLNSAARLEGLSVLEGTISRKENTDGSSHKNTRQVFAENAKRHEQKEGYCPMFSDLNPK